MAEPRFDPSNAVKFDLGRGQVDLDGAPRMLVPVDALLALCKGAGPEALRDFGRTLGTEVGRRVRERIKVDQASLESVVEHLGGDLALSGLGSLAIERWGRALVMTVSDSPLGADGDGLIASVLEGALQRGMGRDARVVKLERKNGLVRLLVTAPKTAEKVQSLLASGLPWGDLLAKLHAGGGA
jgi:hypothetical protein